MALVSRCCCHRQALTRTTTSKAIRSLLFSRIDRGGGGISRMEPIPPQPRPCELNGSPLPFPRGPRGYFQIWEIVCGREGESFLGRVQLSHLGNFFFCSAQPSTFSLSFLQSGRAERQSWAVQGRERWYRKLKASFRIKPRLKREGENEGVQTKRYKSFLIRKARFLVGAKDKKIQIFFRRPVPSLPFLDISAQ